MNWIINLRLPSKVSHSLLLRHFSVGVLRLTPNTTQVKTTISRLPEYILLPMLSCFPAHTTWIHAFSLPCNCYLCHPTMLFSFIGKRAAREHKGLRILHFYYMVEKVHDEKENSDWFPWRSEFCNTDC